MSTANPNRTRVCPTCGTANTCVKCGCCLPGGALVCDDCMNGVCEHNTASTMQPTRAQKEFQAVYESLSAPESDERTTEVGEPLYTLTGLSRRLADSLGSILEAAWENPSYLHLMDDAETLLSMFRAQIGKTHNEFACMHYDDGCRCECPDCS